MTGIEILKEIIAQDGNCSGWANKSLCRLCPMSKLKQRADGSYLSCIEAIGAHNMSEEEADIKYKEVATKMLVDAEMDKLLREE